MVRIIKRHLKFTLVLMLSLSWMFSIYLQVGDYIFFLSKSKTLEAATSAVVSVPRSTHSMTTEQVGGSNTHILILNNPSGFPDYKWQFLDNGVRLFIDRNDGNGWIQLISEIRSVPEYIRRQGQSQNCIWNEYGLAVTTSGSNVLRGWNRQDQGDGSIHLTKTQNGTEINTTETLTSTWIIPFLSEKLGSEGPKVFYSMTKNRGIVVNGPCNEGTWRLKWDLSGISDIVSNNSNIIDSENWPIRRKTYSNREFAIDVSDFDNLNYTSSPNYTFSEISQNNKAQITFFLNGTTNERIIDPTIVTSNIAFGFSHASRNIFYNGSYFFILYSKNDGKIYYKTSTNNSSWSGENTLFTDSHGTSLFNLYIINDTKFDIFYKNSNTQNDRFYVSTCTITGSAISCVTGLEITLHNTTTRIHIVRNPYEDRIWIAHNSAGSAGRIISADQTGDASGITSGTAQYSTGFTGTYGLATYRDSAFVLAILSTDRGGTNSDVLEGQKCSTSGCNGSTIIAEDQAGGGQAGTGVRFGNLVRLSDTDFRYVYITAAGTTIREYKWNNSSWSSLADIDTSGAKTTPTLSYDRSTGDLYAFYASSNTIQRYKKPSGSSWGSKTQVDNSEGDANSNPVSQMHEAPYGSGRTSPLELVWAYRNINGSNYDLVFGNLNLVSSSVPPSVSTYDASGVATSSAVLNGEVTSIGGDSVSDYGFIYTTVSDFSSGIATTSLGTLSEASTFDTTLGSLDSDETYYFKAYAENQYGLSYGSPKNFTTEAIVVSVFLDTSSFAYGSIPDNTASSTLLLFSGAGIVATNDGNTTLDFDIYAANTANWTLSGSTGPDQYVHQFCNDTDNDCSSPPTNYTTLTSSPQVLKNTIADSGTVNFQLRIITPNTSSVYSQQNAIVTVQASLP